MDRVKLFLICSLLLTNLLAQEDIDNGSLLKRIELLEQKVASKQKGVVQLLSDETIMTIGGRIRVDAYFKNPDVSFDANYEVIKDGEANQVGINARNSQLWLKTTTPTELGLMRTLIEMDFFAGSGNEINTNAHSPRLRHAYMSVHGFTIGQTYSFFTTTYTPEILIDPVNETYARQPLIGWGSGDDTLRYDFSLELPETTLKDSSGKRVLPSDDQIPDFVCRVRYFQDFYEISNALILRQIRQDRATINSVALNSSDSEIGWGINSSAKIEIANDDLRVGIVYGNAIGRYIAENSYSDGTIDNVGDIKLHYIFGSHVAYRHQWSKRLRSTLSINYTSAENNTDVISSNIATLGKMAISNNLNLYYIPIKNGLVAIEYAHLKRENEKRESSDIDMYQLTFRYDF